MTERRTICVLGMHRSGSSAITRVLNILGVDLGPEEEIAAVNPNNPKGFCEHRTMRAINDTILFNLDRTWDDVRDLPPGCERTSELEELRREAQAAIEEDFADAEMWGWKDPRTCLTLPFWQQLLPSLDYVLVLRHPAEVARSLERRNRFSIEKGVYLWCTYTLAALEHTAGRRRITVFFEDMMDNPLRELPRLCQFLGRPELAMRSDVQHAILSFLDRDLRHHHVVGLESTTGSGNTSLERALYLAHEAYTTLKRRDEGQVEAVCQMLHEARKVLTPEVSRQQVPDEKTVHVRWVTGIRVALLELARIIGRAESVILVDGDEWVLEQFGRSYRGRRLIPFLEKDGQYWGPPTDDETAIRELERLRESGANFIAFASPAFWWLEHYAGFHRYLRSRFRCLLENDRFVVFDLREPVPCPGAGHGLAKLPLAVGAPADPADGSIPAGPPEAEAISGTEHYLTTLARIHQTLSPELYLEIGVRAGDSLRLARRSAIGIDPDMRLAGWEPAAALYHETSDEFFERHVGEAISRPVDLAFIDGLHLFEYALRDFMNLERQMSPSGLIVVDDIFPNHSSQASRFRRTRVWCGDVWRLLLCLAEHRPDLFLLPLNCSPTGLLLIAGLDPTNRVLWQEYNSIIQRYLSTFPEAPATLIGRFDARDPGNPLLHDLLHGLRQLREEGADVKTVCAFCDEIGGQFRYRSGG